MNPLRRSGRIFFVALCLAATPSAAADDVVVPQFVDETSTSGIRATYAGEWEYMVGGGAAAFDCDDNGYPDLFLSGGSGPSGFYRNISERGGPLRFEKQASGLELGEVAGAYPLDVDSDGHMDLVLLRVGENVAMRGLGGCRFERANEAWGFDGGDAWSTAFAATFERSTPEWPTLAVGNYIDRRKGALPWGSCTDNWLHRPRSDGKPGFEPPLALKPSYCALSMLFTDWNRSGTPSLRVSNDREYYKGGQEQLWRIPPDGVPSLYGVAEGWARLRIWGMGIASRDLDGDGYPEYVLTSMSDNKLQTLAKVPDDGKPVPAYRDVAFARGATAHRPYTGGDVRPSTAWHADFQDVNNDALPDLFIAKGNVAEMPDFAARDPNNLLMQLSDGTFREVGDVAGVASFGIARGAVLTDFNLDGLVDLAVVNRWTPAEIWRNTTSRGGHWVQFRLLDNGENRDGIGAWIEVRSHGRTARREVTVGGGHAGGQAGWLHFGLGDAAQAEFRVIWPDGAEDRWQEVATGSFIMATRGAPFQTFEPK